MKKIFLSVIATAIMTSFSAYAGKGKKAKSKKPARTECCKKSKCTMTADCNKTTCPIMPGCGSK